ncbi:hypothetical protein F2P81_019439 [Scophthalmus maximus]|uniref:Uncharacterized protein n=1 Tax=Scophthalmus maximus TaxID=52904 RepID=A0A6A4SCN8_SCOMX|nr:hypothetical protein F2P81_019439 [Scophthalmus maximus]
MLDAAHILHCATDATRVREESKRTESRERVAIGQLAIAHSVRTDRTLCTTCVATSSWQQILTVVMLRKPICLVEWTVTVKEPFKLCHDIHSTLQQPREVFDTAFLPNSEHEMVDTLAKDNVMRASSS